MSYVAHTYDLGKTAHRLVLDHINSGITIRLQTRKGGLYGAEFDQRSGVTTRAVHDWEDTATHELFYDEAEEFVRTLSNFLEDRPPQPKRIKP